ncbi:hypothetical protein ACNKHT_07900 [Shigella flexneri]
MAPENHDGEKHFAEIVKDFGETSMNDNGLDTGEQAKAFALGKSATRLVNRLIST